MRQPGDPFRRAALPEPGTDSAAVGRVLGDEARAGGIVRQHPFVGLDDGFRAVRPSLPVHQINRAGVVPALALVDVVHAVVCDRARDVMPAARAVHNRRRKVQRRLRQIAQCG